MEKTTSQKIRLGAFVITGLILFIVTIYFIGSRQKLFVKTSDLVSVFENVNGLQQGNNVRYGGINAGTVERIVMINDTSVRVEMIIDNDIFPFIRKNAVASIGSDGLVGNMIVNITPGTDSQPQAVPGDEIKSYTRISTDEILNTLNETNENAAILSSDLLKITHSVLEGEGTVGKLINDTILAHSIVRIMYYAELTTKGATESVDGLNNLVKSLNSDESVVGVLKDTTAANNLRASISGLETVTIQMQEVMENLKNGDGAINYLSNDQELVKKIDHVMSNLDTTMVNLNKASILLNEDLEAMQHNIFTRGYFKKKEKEEMNKK